MCTISSNCLQALCLNARGVRVAWNKKEVLSGQWGPAGPAGPERVGLTRYVISLGQAGRARSTPTGVYIACCLPVANKITFPFFVVVGPKTSEKNVLFKFIDRPTDRPHTRYGSVRAGTAGLGVCFCTRADLFEVAAFASRTSTAFAAGRAAH